MRTFSFVAATLVVSVSALGAQAPRPWTFLDQQMMRQVGGVDLSADGQRLLYTLSVPDWKQAKRFTDIWVVSTAQGAPSARQLTFTKEKNEGSPQWNRDGSFFVFASNRDAPNNGTVQQLYMMRPDGGEAQRITDAKDGVGQHQFTRDGRWLVYSAGKTEEQQLWALPIAGIDTAKPVQITKHPSPVGSWQLTRDGTRVFFLAPDSVDKDEKARREKQFTVNVRNAATPPQSLWMVEIPQSSRSG